MIINNWGTSNCKSNNNAARLVQSKGLFTSIKYNTMTLTVDRYLAVTPHLTCSESVLTIIYVSMRALLIF